MWGIQQKELKECIILMQNEQLIHSQTTSSNVSWHESQYQSYAHVQC
jgi:hypothetical protein